MPTHPPFCYASIIIIMGCLRCKAQAKVRKLLTVRTFIFYCLILTLLIRDQRQPIQFNSINTLLLLEQPFPCGQKT